MVLDDLTEMFVAEQLPLKQGLKPIAFFISSIPCIVAEQLPLKQGLKRQEVKRAKIAKCCRRATSIKTRIETRLHQD